MTIKERWDDSSGDRYRRRAAMERLLSIGGFVSVLIALMGFYALWIFVPLLLVIAYRELAPARAQLRERARLIRDCHSQHDALMLGGEQDAWAYFGYHQPAGIDGKISWCAPPEAFPTVSRVADGVGVRPLSA